MEAHKMVRLPAHRHHHHTNDNPGRSHEEK